MISTFRPAIEMFMQTFFFCSEIPTNNSGIGELQMVITKTPLRISFFGGGTDYPVWYQEHGGADLYTTIDNCCYITCRPLPPFFEYHSRISYSAVENVDKNDDIRLPSVRGCLQFMGIG